MAERLQKVLAGAGIASRRDAEAWIKAGRVTVNGRPAELGLKVEPEDVIAVDGRRLRLERAVPGDLVLIYHRPPGESLKATPSEAADSMTSTYERLPTVRGRRWLPLSPLAPMDGGLEVFTTDGTLRAAASRASGELPSSYAVRVGGEPTEALMANLPAAAASLDPPFEIERVKSIGGEGRNRWYEFDVRRAAGRDLRFLLTEQGLEVSRILRTRFGPVTMDRSISRGRHRELDTEERDLLYLAVGLPSPLEVKQRPKADSRSAPPSARVTRGPRGKGRSA